jgi:hypothetical protein
VGQDCPRGWLEAAQGLEGVSWHQDYSGLYHYRFESALGTVSEAIQEALATRPLGPAWFWFNDTFCPMQPPNAGADPEQEAIDLYSSWSHWRDSYKNGNLLDALLQLNKSGTKKSPESVKPRVDLWAQLRED